LITEAGSGSNQDRGIVVREGVRLVLCVADGAGGVSGGAEAAQMVVSVVSQRASLLNDANACGSMLRQLDILLANDSAAGETTGVLASIENDKIFGASVGDSGAWLIQAGDSHTDLTASQQRKPLLGSGRALPTRFEAPLKGAALLLATDGLLKYAPAARIATISQIHPPEDAAKKLIELVRYRSGALPDDTTVILTRLGRDFLETGSGATASDQ